MGCFIKYILWVLRDSGNIYLGVYSCDRSLLTVQYVYTGRDCWTHVITLMVRHVMILIRHLMARDNID